MKRETFSTAGLCRISDDPRVRILRRALGEDADLHFVGGTVRDVMLQKEASDLDLATALLPDEIISRLKASDVHVIPTGLRHQTVTAVPLADKGNVEITTFRGANMNPTGGVVASKEIREDLKFRDFSINAIAFHIDSQELIDSQGGLLDLQEKTIRAVGLAKERFSEDPLRTLRMIRLACQLQFQIAPETLQAAKAFSEVLGSISVERIRDELSKMLLSDEPSRAFRLLRELGFLEVILPEVAEYVDFEQNSFHKDDLFDHTLEVLEKTSADLVLRLAAVFHDVGKPATLSVDERGERHFYRHEAVGTDITKDALSRLRYPNAVVSDVCTLVRTHMRPIDAGPGGLRRLLRDTGELFESWRKLKEADASACKLDPKVLRAELERFDDEIAKVQAGPELSPLKNLAITGNDLLELGIPEGPRIGEILRTIHEKVLDDPNINQSETLLALAKDLAEE